MLKCLLFGKFFMKKLFRHFMFFNYFQSFYGFALNMFSMHFLLSLSQVRNFVPKMQRRQFSDLVTDHNRYGQSCPRIPTIVHDKTCHNDFGGFQKRPSDSIIRFSDTWFLSLSIVVLLGSPSR